MTVRLHLRGTMLYYCPGESLDRIFLPDCLRPPPGGGHHGERMTHRDGSEARMHFHGILFTRNGVEVGRQPVFNTTIEVQGAGQQDISKASLARLPNLPSDVWGVDLDQHPFTSVIVRGVSGIRTGYSGTRPFAFEEQNNLHDFTTISLGAQATIATDGFGTYELADNEEVFIYNFDVPLPSVKDLTQPIPYDSGEIVDDDFKWVFALTKVKEGKTDLDDFSMLKAPRTSDFSILTLLVSTCFSAVGGD